MTLTPSLPTDPADLYAMMSVETLLAHLRAVTAEIERSGVEITPDARRGLDEIEECVLEHFARNDHAALGRHLATQQQMRVVTPS